MQMMKRLKLSRQSRNGLTASNAISGIDRTARSILDQSNDYVAAGIGSELGSCKNIFLQSDWRLPVEPINWMETFFTASQSGSSFMPQRILVLSRTPGQPCQLETVFHLCLVVKEQTQTDGCCQSS